MFAAAFKNQVFISLYEENYLILSVEINIVSRKN